MQRLKKIKPQTRAQFILDKRERSRENQPDEPLKTRPPRAADTHDDHRDRSRGPAGNQRRRVAISLGDMQFRQGGARRPAGDTGEIPRAEHERSDSSGRVRSA